MLYFLVDFTGFEREMYEASYEYGVPGLRERAKRALFDSLTPATVLEILPLFSRYDRKLKVAALKFAAAHLMEASSLLTGKYDSIASEYPSQLNL